MPRPAAEVARIWSAFWIQSTEISKVEDRSIYGAEIDIMEFFKKLGTDIVSHNVHWAYGPHQKSTHGIQNIEQGLGRAATGGGLSVGTAGEVERGMAVVHTQLIKPSCLDAQTPHEVIVVTRTRLRPGHFCKRT